MELNAMGRYIYLNRINKTMLCAFVGITRATLYRNMEGKIKMPFYQVEKIAAFLKTDINQFRETK